MEKCCYLDNSSTTELCPSAKNIMAQIMEESWGNPSSLHSLGVKSEKAITAARQSVASVLSADPSEIIFTASGTEANNMAIFGAAQKGAKRGKRVVTTAVEHPSVALCFDRLEQQGFEVIRLATDQFGIVNQQDIFNAVNSDTILVSIMLVNNELGGINPVKTAASAIKRAKAPALLHCDAVQAFGKIDVNPASLGVDLLSISAHKIHGPKGVGVLYKRKGLTIPPLMLGGGQEKNMRPGTEAVHQIAGMGAAVEELKIKEAYQKVADINAYARERLVNEEIGEINSSPEALPYILNISIPGYRSETVMHFLELRGIYVSSGSACAKGSSHILSAAGLSAARSDSALRISFSRYNEREDVDLLVAALKEAKELIVHSKE